MAVGASKRWKVYEALCSLNANDTYTLVETVHACIRSNVLRMRAFGHCFKKVNNLHRRAVRTAVRHFSKKVTTPSHACSRPRLQKKMNTPSMHVVDNVSKNEHTCRQCEEVHFFWNVGRVHAYERCSALQRSKNEHTVHACSGQRSKKMGIPSMH